MNQAVPVKMAEGEREREAEFETVFEREATAVVDVAGEGTGSVGVRSWEMEDRRWTIRRLGYG